LAEVSFFETRVGPRAAYFTITHTQICTLLRLRGGCENRVLLPDGLGTRPPHPPSPTAGALQHCGYRRAVRELIAYLRSVHFGTDRPAIFAINTSGALFSHHPGQMFPQFAKSAETLFPALLVLGPKLRVRRGCERHLRVACRKRDKGRRSGRPSQ